MDPNLIDQFTEVLRPQQDNDPRQKLLSLAGQINGLTKDLREAIAFIVTETLCPNDAKVIAAYAPHRKDATNSTAINNRMRTILISFGTNNNSFTDHPEVFDLVAGLRSCLECKPKNGDAPKDLADLAVHYAQAKETLDARKSLAGYLYTPRGELTPTANRLLAPPAPPWLKEKFERAVGDAKPQLVPTLGKWRAVRDRFAKTWRHVRRFEPSFLLALGVLAASIALFAVSIVLARPKKEPVADSVMPVALVAPEKTVYAQLSARLKEKKEELSGSILVISPRARDDGDILLTEAITAANLQNVTVVPWTETRAAIGPDAPPFSKGWLTSVELAQLCQPRDLAPKPNAEKLGKEHWNGQAYISYSEDPEPKTEKQIKQPRSGLMFYVDIELEGTDQARVSVVSLNVTPGVLLIVRGPATTLKPPMRSGQFIQRALALGGYLESPAVSLLLRKARAAAVTDGELAKVELTEALVYVAGGKSGEAENVLRRVWPWLLESDKQRLPDPLRRKMEAEMRSLEDRVREQLELKK